MANPGEDWHARAVAMFPELSEDLKTDGYIAFQIYALCSELETMVRVAHRESDDDMLRRIYGYASWARDQPEVDIWNAIGVCFYEHLFDERWMRPLVIPWVTSTDVREYMGLWEFRLPPADLEEVRRLLYRGRLLHLKGQSRKRRQ